MGLIFTTQIVSAQTICQTIGNDSQALYDNGYVTGPENKIPNQAVHTDTKWISVAGTESLDITTLQHRLYDRSRIYDQNNNLIWEWSGESVPATTWYTKNHTVNVAGNDKVRIEFYQGYPAFCIGFLKITKMNCSNVPAPVTATISASTPTTFCSGGSVQLISAIAPTGVYQYQWIKDGVNISGQNTSSYIANTTGNYSLKVTALNSSVYTSNIVNVTVNPLPTIPEITHASPALICQGSSIKLSCNSSSNVSFQWYLNNNAITGASSNSYDASVSGAYRLFVTDLTTKCSNTSQNVVVGELPNIVENTINSCGNPVTISLTNPNFSHSTLPASCSVDMSGANIVTTNIGGNGGGGRRTIICYGGRLTNQGGLNTFVVEYGGTFDFSAGSGANTVYVKSGGICNIDTGGGGGNIVYYEPGAIINGGNVQKIQCANIGIVYPSNATVCNNFTYLWSNGATTPTISVNPSQTTTYTVTVSYGGFSCTDSVQVIVQNPIPVITASGSTTFCSGSSVTLTSSSAMGNVWSNGATTKSIIVNQSGDYFVTVSNGDCSAKSASTTITVNPNPTVAFASSTVAGKEGTNVDLSANVSIPGSSLQWQTNVANLGWTAVPANNYYAGVATNVLKVNAIQSQNHLQEFRLIATSGDCSTISDVLKIDVENSCNTLLITTTLGLPDSNVINTVTIYPNPAKDHITIDCGNIADATGYQIQIFNVLGQTVFSGSMNTQQYNVSLGNWGGTGVYLVKILDASSKEVNTKKIIIE